MASIPTPRPLWRWWLFCAVVPVVFRFGWRWASRLMSWCVLPEWLGIVDGVDVEPRDAWANRPREP